MTDELDEVRAQLQDSTLFSPAVLAQLDGFRASVHEQLRARGVDPTSEEFELIWMVAGGTLAQLIASDATTEILSGIDNAVHRGAVGAHLLWSAGISPHPIEKLPR